MRDRYTNINCKEIDMEEKNVPTTGADTKGISEIVKEIENNDDCYEGISKTDTPTSIARKLIQKRQNDLKFVTLS